MAPSPRTGSRQDATALPSMSSTFWAFMILASLLIAYCKSHIRNQALRSLSLKIRDSNKLCGPHSVKRSISAWLCN
ncbi:hypothetical protein JEQ12_015251 [Ovis aries]|uniref:Uncharacterized protein n=1 Tax=Ovis aries TaxID=9940 RepID=A0A836ABL8_SHEEP|nr:hypothetical protein JEQ12_015251 [Ovis aries]